MRLGSIYKLQLAASRTECKRLGDLRAVTSAGKQEQGPHGLGSISSNQQLQPVVELTMDLG